MNAPRCAATRLTIAGGLFCSILFSHTSAEVPPAKIPTIRVNPRMVPVAVAAPLPRFKIKSGARQTTAATGSPPATSSPATSSPATSSPATGSPATGSPATGLPTTGAEVNVDSLGLAAINPDTEPSLPTNIEAANTNSKPTEVPSVDDKRTPDSTTLRDDRAPKSSVEYVAGTEGWNESSLPAVRGVTREPKDASDATELPAVSTKVLDRLRLPPQIQTRAGKMMKEGTSLAKRGAMFSARQEFLGVLKLVAQAYDSQLGVRYHSKALANGLRALKEADDFVGYGADSTVDVDLRPFIAGHKTPVLKDRATEFITPYVAMQHYYDYARDQLALAGNRAPTASAALYAIGRVEVMLARSGSGRGALGPKPLAYYQSAVVVDQRNFAAANELGVMLARAGKYQEAHAVLNDAAKTRPTKTLVGNLAKVERLMGDGQTMARHPTQRATARDTSESLARRIPVQWVNPIAFNNPQGPPPGPAANPVTIPGQRLWPQPNLRVPTNVARQVPPFRGPTRPVR